MPSAFSYDATTQTLTITGTPSNDLFQYNQSTTAVNALGGVTFYTFTMNGETQQYGGELTPHIAQVIVNGNGGADTATLTINDGYQLPNLPQTFYNTSVMILGPGGGRLQHDLNLGDNHTPQPTDFMFLNQFRTTYTYLTNGNKDSAQLTDSTTGSDRFVTAGTYAYMTDNPNNPTYFQFVSGASNVYGYSTNPGHDSTTHYDAAGSVDLREVQASGAAQLLGHATDPGVLLGLARRAFGHSPPGWSLAIEAVDFGFGDDLSPTAQKGLENAVEKIKILCRRLQTPACP